MVTPATNISSQSGKNMTKAEYYELINNLPKEFPGDSGLRITWYRIFEYVLKGDKFGKKAIDTLFHDFTMSNFEPWHLENTKYNGYDTRQLYEHFVNDLQYCSDRMSMDRVFRLHWVYNRIIDSNRKNEPGYPWSMSYSYGDTNELYVSAATEEP